EALFASRGFALDGYYDRYAVLGLASNITASFFPTSPSGLKQMHAAFASGPNGALLGMLLTCMCDRELLANMASLTGRYSFVSAVFFIRYGWTQSTPHRCDRGLLQRPQPRSEDDVTDRGDREVRAKLDLRLRRQRLRAIPIPTRGDAH